MPYVPLEIYAVKSSKSVTTLALAKEAGEDSDLFLLTGGAAPMAVILTGMYAGRGFELANMRSDLNLVVEGIEILVDPTTTFRPAYVKEPVGAIHLANGVSAISYLTKDRHGFDKVQIARFNDPQTVELSGTGEAIGFKSWRIVKRFKDEVISLLDFSSTLAGDR